MDPLRQALAKHLAERTTDQQQQAPPPDTAPPPYASSTTTTSDEEEEEGDEEEQPLKLTINAAHQIRGSNNLVPTTTTSPLADATKFSTLLLNAVRQLNHSASGGRMKVDLTINCGLTVVGDRNVVGHVGLRPKAVGERGDVVAGAKRKVDGDEGESEEPEAKRAHVEGAAAS